MIFFSTFHVNFFHFLLTIYLQDNHPDEFRTLTVAWFSFHPDNSWMSYGQVQNTSQYNWNSDNSGDRGRGGGGGGLGYNEFQRVQSEYGGPAYGGYGGPVYEGGGSPLSGKGGLIQAPVALTPALVQARLVSDSTTYSPIQQMQSDQYGTSIHQSQYQHIENVQHSSNEPYSSQGQHVPYTQYTGALPLSSTTKPSTPSAPPMI